MNEIKIARKQFSIGMVLLLAGFVIMALGKDEYSFFKITLAPIFILGGYVYIAFSILVKKRTADV